VKSFFCKSERASRLYSAIANYIDNPGGIITDAFKMPTRAGSEYVLTFSSLG